MPYLSPDGMLVFPERGDTGALVITPHGVMFRDRAEPPARVSYPSPFEPWRNPAGFIAPVNGIFTHTSRATLIVAHGLVVSVRPSDEFAPTWGGDLLLRIDVAAASRAARAPIDVAIVLDGSAPDTAALVAVALEQLGSEDRVMLVDAHGAHILVPWLPAGHRSLVQAAVERHLSQERRRAMKPDLPRAVQLAWSGSPQRAGRKVLVLTEGTDPDAIRAQVPASGPVAYKNLVLRFEGLPGPSHVLEASGGVVSWDLQADRLALGEVRAGESRTEVARLSMPGWPATLSFELRFSLQFHEASTGLGRNVEAVLQLPYDEDIVRIAHWRCGDVLAYASALAWMNRLRAAFAGEGIERAGGLYQVARLHQASMLSLARDRGDSAAMQQALLLSALLDANP